LQERAVLEEELYWARLERQKFLSLSAEADETIWNPAALARKTMQERDEATNQTRMILEDVQVRNARMTTMLAGQERSGAARPAGFFPGAGTNSQALPPPFGPLREMTMQGQHGHRLLRCIVQQLRPLEPSFDGRVHCSDAYPWTRHFLNPRAFRP
jgi:hypothetical protein